MRRLTNKGDVCVEDEGCINFSLGYAEVDGELKRPGKLESEYVAILNTTRIIIICSNPTYSLAHLIP